MTISSQLGAFAIAGGDIPCKNYHASLDIAAGTVVVFDATAANLMGVLAPATSAEAWLTAGVAIETIAAGKTGRVRMIGAAVCTSNATLVKGDRVQIETATGKEGQVKKLVTGKTQLGTCLNDCVAGDPCLVLITIASATQGT